MAPGIGFASTALSLYDLWLGHGHDAACVKYTRIKVTVMTGRGTLKGLSLQIPSDLPVELFEVRSRQPLFSRIM